MPPHMHPRSRMTSSLFATTVAASFLVVGLPHLLPCPAPRVAYADAASADAAGGGGGGGNSNRRRPRPRSPQQDDAEVKDGIARFEGVGGAETTTSSSSPSSSSSSSSSASSSQENITSTAPRSKRECPVPKPGVIGEMMGFKKTEPGKTSKVKTGETTQNIATTNNDR